VVKDPGFTFTKISTWNYAHRKEKLVNITGDSSKTLAAFKVWSHLSNRPKIRQETPKRRSHSTKNTVSFVEHG